MKLLTLFVIAFSVIACSSDGSSPSFIVSETAPSSDHMKAFTEALEKFVDVSEDPNNIRYDLMPERQSDIKRVAEEAKTEINKLDPPPQCIILRDGMVEWIDYMVQMTEDIVYMAQTGEVSEFLHSVFTGESKDDVWAMQQADQLDEDYFKAVAECES